VNVLIVDKHRVEDVEEIIEKTIVISKDISDCIFSNLKLALGEVS
jgi:hypothetical protein